MIVKNNIIKDSILIRKENIQKEIEKISKDTHEPVDLTDKEIWQKENKFLIEVFSETSFKKREEMIKFGKENKIDMMYRFYAESSLTEPLYILFHNKDKSQTVETYKGEVNDYEIDIEKIINLFEKTECNRMLFRYNLDIRSVKGTTILILEK